MMTSQYILRTERMVLVPRTRQDRRWREGCLQRRSAQRGRGQDAKVPRWQHRQRLVWLFHCSHLACRLPPPGAGALATTMVVDVAWLLVTLLFGGVIGVRTVRVCCMCFIGDAFSHGVALWAGVLVSCALTPVGVVSPVGCRTGGGPQLTRRATRGGNEVMRKTW